MSPTHITTKSASSKTGRFRPSPEMNKVFRIISGTLANFDTPCGLAVWKDGQILIADTGNKRIRVLEQNGNVSTLAGNGNSNLVDGILSESEFVQPTAIAFDEIRRDLYCRRKCDSRHRQKHFSVSSKRFQTTGAVYTDGKLRGSHFNRPSGLAVDENGNFFVADSDNKTVRVFSGEQIGVEISDEQKRNLKFYAGRISRSAAAALDF